MVQTARVASWRSPTDVSAPASASASSSAAAASSASSASSSAVSSPSCDAFFPMQITPESSELFKLSAGDGGAMSDFAGVDVASAFARVVGGEDATKSMLLLDQHDDNDGDFDMEMRDFEFDSDSHDHDGGGTINFAANASGAASRGKASGAKAASAKPKQPRKRATAPISKKESARAIKQEAASASAATASYNESDEMSPLKQLKQGGSEEALSTLELRRKRNRDSMRRARNRQRNEQEKLESMIDQLEDRLESLMRAKENSLAAAVSTNSSSSSSAMTSYSYSAYSSLLRQTELLRDQNDDLSEQLRKHSHFQDRIGKLAEQEKKQLDAEIQADEADQDHEMLQPLLTWVTRATCIELVNYGRDRILEVAELTETLVPVTHSVLGWEGKRTIHANWAHYTMKKRFQHESAEWLAKRTWECTVNQDVGEMKQVLSWAHGTKVLHRLSSDAVIIARDMLVPNLQDIDHPIRIRYILLVFKTPIPGGFVVGTMTLNVYGSSVEDCLEQKVSHKNGMHALTMYAFLFTRIRASETGEDLGCSITLAGRSGDGSLMYARKVLFEVLPSILRWENTFVAPILRVTG